MTASFVVVLLLASNASFAEDIELYLSDSIKQSQTRPKVLISFDTSGSMGWDGQFKPAYIPGHDYDAIPGYSKISGDIIYYSKGDTATNNTPIPDNPTEERVFLNAINGCAKSKSILDEQGYYTGRIREYVFQGNSGRWAEIPEQSGKSIKVIDCEDDVVDGDNNNAQMLSAGGLLQTLPAPENGFPINGEGTQASPQFHTALVENSNVSWSGELVTLYKASYLRWQQNDTIPKVTRTRLEVAKESVLSLIRSTPNVDFGLQVYNRNSSNKDKDGGRIVHGIRNTTDTERNTLLDIVENKIYAQGSTPICESAYEAARYLGGKSIKFGHKDTRIPSWDNESDVESGLNYVSPFSPCSDRIYVILITDGEPTNDNNANDLIKNLPETDQDAITSSDKFHYKTDSNGNKHYSYLPALAGWINNNDVNTSLDGTQTVETYSVAFSDGALGAESLLKETAKRGGGKYFYAEDSAALTSALTNVLASIEPGNDSLTSASVASNNFDRTETLDAVYYAMFQPDRGPRWQGNLKKYKVIDGVQKGSNDVNAINSATGHFSDLAQSYWSSDVDGDSVSSGGVAEMLRNKTDRVIYSNLGNNNALVPLTYADASSSTAYPTPADLATALDVTNDETTIKASLNWINGKDVDDADEDGVTLSENRPDVFGDPLHSKPVVINYGNDNIYIVVGTNHGVLHMFKDNDAANTIDEAWAFMPKRFMKNVKALRDNYTSADKVYGADGLITSHIVDKNGNGIVDIGEDKVWLFFGLRRGGSAYYAMDVTNPASPSVMWIIEGGVKDGDFEELGQSWSQPKVTYSKLNVSGTEAKPVLVFGGGYDISKDSHSVGGEDSQGRAIYMLDAETGDLKWSLSPTGDTIFDGKDSIPSSIATLDSDGDGLTDRLYAGDTGGNVWRVDMPGGDKSKFSVFKLAELGGDASNEVDRRFFSEPAIVRAFITETIDSGKKDADNKPIIVQQDIPYDAVLLGSGDKTNPIGTDTKDTFFMIKDINIRTQEFTASSKPEKPTVPIKIGDLADYTNNPFSAPLTSQEKETLSLQVSLKSGWYINLEQVGEKSTSSALVINNVVYFTSYIPPSGDESAVSCDLPNGQGWLYAVDLSLGLNKYSWAADDPNNTDDRKTFISEQFLGAPTLIVTKKTNADTGDKESDGNIIVGRKVVPVGFTLQTLRTYLYVTEN